MKLSYEGSKDSAAWEKAGVEVPRFDHAQMCLNTEAAPVWVHFGPGNIFRGFIAGIQHRLLDSGLEKSGIIAAVPSDKESIELIFKPYDCMCMTVSLLPDGSIKKQAAASVAQALSTEAGSGDMDRLRQIFRKPSLQLLSFTITEKGYAIKDMHGEYLPAARADMDNGPGSCRHAMGKTAELLLERYRAGAYPIAVVSMDNCSHNGELLRRNVLAMAESWKEKGFVPEGFIDWLSDEEKVSFPWTMIDKITPGPSKEVEKLLRDGGIEDMDIRLNSRGRPLAPFVNAEEPQYLVIEDRFPNGRPPFEKAGVYMTDRETVSKTERMKVTTCLNPLHTALAVYGCMLGYDRIWKEMKDPELKALVERIGLTEGLPVVTDPGILSPEAFIREVLEVRLPNPFMPDMPQRIAMDTSQKVPIRYGETIKSYIRSETLDIRTLTFIPLAIAGWMRYLLAVDDEGNTFECSSDPMLDVLQKQLDGVRLGEPDSVDGKLYPILSNPVLFGTDLVEAELAEKIEAMVKEMLAGSGAVRSCLKKYLATA